LNTFRVLLVKFVMTFIVAMVAFSFLETNPAGLVVLVALIATAGNYLVGDLHILPVRGNMTASLGNGLLGALLAYIVSLISVTFNTSFAALFVFAILVAVGEYFFHPYLQRVENVAPGPGPAQEQEPPPEQEGGDQQNQG
jgi:hypothetical protein